MEDLYFDMVDWIHSVDEECSITNLHWFVGKNGDVTDQMWLDTTSGESHNLPERFMPLIAANYIS